MNRTALLVVTLLVLSTGPAHATNMMAGPLVSAGTDRCSCEIFNVSASAKTIQVQAIDGGGNIILNSGVIALLADNGGSFSPNVAR